MQPPLQVLDAPCAHACPLGQGLLREPGPLPQLLEQRPEVRRGTCSLGLRPHGCPDRCSCHPASHRVLLLEHYRSMTAPTFPLSTCVARDPISSSLLRGAASLDQP